MSAPRHMGRPLTVTVLGVGFAASALIAGAVPAAGQVAPEEVLSHFLCYRGTFPPFDPVSNVVFEDQFVSTAFTVRNPRLLCNPVRKTRRGGEVTRIVDPSQHLKAYKVVTTPATGTIDLIDRNQFGEQRISVEQTPTMALLPTRKAPHEAPEDLDHFLCYPVVIGQAVDRRVELKDQFTSFRTRVARPKLHCNPAFKSHPPNPPVLVEHEFAHLLCYGIEPRRLDPPIARRTANQFETARVRSEVAVMLCVPSTKAVVV